LAEGAKLRRQLYDRFGKRFPHEKVKSGFFAHKRERVPDGRERQAGRREAAAPSPR